MTIDEAKEFITSMRLRPLVQRGFYSHFIRAIDDGREFFSATADINRRGQINKKKLIHSIHKRQRRMETTANSVTYPLDALSAPALGGDNAK